MTKSSDSPSFSTLFFLPRRKLSQATVFLELQWMTSPSLSSSHSSSSMARCGSEVVLGIPRMFSAVATFTTECQSNTIYSAWNSVESWKESTIWPWERHLWSYIFQVRYWENLRRTWTRDIYSSLYIFLLALSCTNFTVRTNKSMYANKF